MTLQEAADKLWNHYKDNCWITSVGMGADCLYVYTNPPRTYNWLHDTEKEIVELKLGWQVWIRHAGQIRRPSDN